MRTDDLRKSDRVRDNRGAPRGAVVGGLGLVAVVLLVALLGGDPTQVIEQVGQPAGGGGDYVPGSNPEQDEQVEFVRAVLGSTEDVWTKLFRDMGREYQLPELEVFTGSAPTACGLASAAVGPFYCPGDKDVYIDLSFYETLKNRLGADGDFAQAYVIAHEVGHHVQNLLGIMQPVHEKRGRVSDKEFNRLSVRLELQADFFAGVWAHHAQRMWNVLEPGDLDEALNAAEAIGDDKLQREQTGHVRPDSFTHGTSAQRMAWFELGFRTGDPALGDTFDEAHFRRVTPR